MNKKAVNPFDYVFIISLIVTFIVSTLYLSTKIQKDEFGENLVNSMYSNYNKITENLLYNYTQIIEKVYKNKKEWTDFLDVQNQKKLGKIVNENFFYDETNKVFIVGNTLSINELFLYLDDVEYNDLSYEFNKYKLYLSSFYFTDFLTRSRTNIYGIKNNKKYSGYCSDLYNNLKNDKIRFYNTLTEEDLITHYLVFLASDQECIPFCDIGFYNFRINVACGSEKRFNRQNLMSVVANDFNQAYEQSKQIINETIQLVDNTYFSVEDKLILLAYLLKYNPEKDSTTMLNIKLSDSIEETIINNCLMVPLSEKSYCQMLYEKSKQELYNFNKEYSLIKYLRDESVKMGTIYSKNLIESTLIVPPFPLEEINSIYFQFYDFAENLNVRLNSIKNEELENEIIKKLNNTIYPILKDSLWDYDLNFSPILYSYAMNLYFNVLENNNCVINLYDLVPSRSPYKIISYKKGNEVVSVNFSDDNSNILINIEEITSRKNLRVSLTEKTTCKLKNYISFRIQFIGNLLPKKLNYTGREWVSTPYVYDVIFVNATPVDYLFDPKTCFELEVDGEKDAIKIKPNFLKSQCKDYFFDNGEYKLWNFVCFEGDVEVKLSDIDFSKSYSLRDYAIKVQDSSSYYYYLFADNLKCNDKKIEHNKAYTFVFFKDKSILTLESKYIIVKKYIHEDLEIPIVGKEMGMDYNFVTYTSLKNENEREGVCWFKVNVAYKFIINNGNDLNTLYKNLDNSYFLVDESLKEEYINITYSYNIRINSKSLYRSSKFNPAHASALDPDMKDLKMANFTLKFMNSGGYVPSDLVNFEKSYELNYPYQIKDEISFKFPVKDFFEKIIKDKPLLLSEEEVKSSTIISNFILTYSKDTDTLEKLGLKNVKLVLKSLSDEVNILHLDPSFCIGEKEVNEEKVEILESIKPTLSEPTLEESNIIIEELTEEFSEEIEEEISEENCVSEIIDFVADKNEIYVNEKISFSWNVNLCENQKLLLNCNILGKVDVFNKMFNFANLITKEEISFSTPGEYICTLSILLEDGTTIESNSISINVKENIDPLIRKFEVDNWNILAEQNVKISWEVEEGNKKVEVSLSDGKNNEKVKLIDSTTKVLKENTNFQLIVETPEKKISKELLVCVYPIAKIDVEKTDCDKGKVSISLEQSSLSNLFSIVIDKEYLVSKSEIKKDKGIDKYYKEFNDISLSSLKEIVVRFNHPICNEYRYPVTYTSSKSISDLILNKGVVQNLIELTDLNVPFSQEFYVNFKEDVKSYLNMPIYFLNSRKSTLFQISNLLNFKDPSNKYEIKYEKNSLLINRTNSISLTDEQKGMLNSGATITIVNYLRTINCDGNVEDISFEYQVRKKENTKKAEPPCKIETFSITPKDGVTVNSNLKISYLVKNANELFLEIFDSSNKLEQKLDLGKSSFDYKVLRAGDYVFRLRCKGKDNKEVYSSEIRIPVKEPATPKLSTTVTEQIKSSKSSSVTSSTEVKKEYLCRSFDMLEIADKSLPLYSSTTFKYFLASFKDTFIFSFENKINSDPNKVFLIPEEINVTLTLDNNEQRKISLSKYKKSEFLQVKFNDNVLINFSFYYDPNTQKLNFSFEYDLLEYTKSSPYFIFIPIPDFRVLPSGINFVKSIKFDYKCKSDTEIITSSLISLDINNLLNKLISEVVSLSNFTKCWFDGFKDNKNREIIKNVNKGITDQLPIFKYNFKNFNNEFLNSRFNLSILKYMNDPSISVHSSSIFFICLVSENIKYCRELFNYGDEEEPENSGKKSILEKIMRLSFNSNIMMFPQLNTYPYLDVTKNNFIPHWMLINGMNLKNRDVDLDDVIFNQIMKNYKIASQKFSKFEITQSKIHLGSFRIEKIGFSIYEEFLINSKILNQMDIIFSNYWIDIFGRDNIERRGILLIFKGNQNLNYFVKNYENNKVKVLNLKDYYNNAKFHTQNLNNFCKVIP
ncbi:MAG: hypothetical protein QXR30_02805 [Candidatus Woesearchaeota archaeon]